MNARVISSRTVSGGLILVLGLLLLLGTTNTYDTGDLWQFVPSLFVLVGVWALVASGFRSLVGPLVVIAVFGVAQLVVLDVVTDAMVETWWPLGLVLLGVLVLFGHTITRRGTSVVAGDAVNLFAAFGGVERIVSGDRFRRADVVALFGGAELDLRDVTVPEDDRPLTVDVFCLFGGVDVTVPEEWDVQTTVVPVFGAAEDERRRSDARDGVVDLHVTGLVGFGGVTVN
jgi:hypothetical protein